MDARVKWQRIKDNPQHNAICFEPLEPRLLLSGTWGASADSPVSESSGFEQATVATTTEAETGQTEATDGAIDLLGTAPTIHLIDSDNADTDAAPTSESTAAQAESSESSNAPDSSDAASLDDSLSQPSDTQSVRELIIVNDNVADYEQLIADLQDGDGDRIIDVAVIDADGDGIQQVSEILSQYSDLSAVHFITHGADNRINIGGTWLNESSLPQYENAVSNWGNALNEDGDLLFYGCNVASGGAGQNLLDHIADLTGADVAASDDPTGSTQLGGDWDLEFNSGAIETQVVVDAGAQAGWEHLMVAPDDLQATTTTNGGLQLNHDGGNDAYLIADDGGTLLGGLSQMTFEMRFSTTHAMTDNVLVSYAEAGDADEFSIFIDGSGNLNVSLAGSSMTSLSGTFDYSTIEDGNTHALALTWDNSAGDWEIFVDGVSVDSGTGLSAAATIAGGGELVFGQEQDSVDGGYDPTQRFAGTLFDARFFNTVRSSGDIATNHQSILPYDESNMIANWTFDNFSTGGVVTDKVSGNNLTEQHAAGGGFSASMPELTMSVDENAANGTVVGTVIGNDAERQAQIATLLGADPDLSYSSITNKFYKSVTSAVTWTTAESNAQSTTLSGVSGQLVTIHSAAENEIVYNLVQSLGGHTHIGASDATTEGEWRWQSGGADADQFWQGDETGSAFNGSYQHWNTGQPNDLGGTEDYAGMDVSNGRWYDLNGSLNNYIVEWDADDVLDVTDELTYSIQSQTVSGAFTIDSDSGEITVADGSLLDYETNPIHTITVRVTDVNETLTYDEVFTISLNNVNEDPVITSSAAVNLEENQTAATTVTATDVDGDTPTFSITGGADAGFFSINSTTGDLTFDSAPDYENPLDADTDNVYEVEVTADDGNGGTDIQTISVTVTDAAPAVPAVSGPSPIQTIDEDNPLVLSTGGGNAISISTSDADDIVEVTLDFPGGANGTLTLNGTAGLTFSIGTGTGDTSMRFHGTVADINAALDGLRFDPDSNWNSGGLSFGLEVNAVNKTLCYSDPALLAHYTFDDVALGNDSSPNGYDGTINGATVQVDSERGEVLYLDGNANMEVPGRFGDPTTDLTLTAWVNVGTLDTNGAEIISLGDSVGMRVVDDAGSNKLQIFWYDGTTDQVLTNASVMGSGWHFVALTMHQTDPSFVEGEIYMDGSYGTFSVWPGPITYGGAKGADSFVGTHGNGAAGYDFEGSIDEVCVFDRVLDYSEISAFRQSTSRLVNIAVNAVNDAPVLTPASPTLTTITEDDTGNAGQTVASFVGASISDADSGAVEGIAITGLVNGNGGWEYSTNGGSSWNSVGAVADGSALLLRSSDLVRFVPDGQNATTGSITYRAWDQTSGSAGTMVDASTNGGTTAFSTATDTAGITVTAINDAPVLTGDLTATVDESGEYYLTSADLGYTDPDDVDAGVTFTVSNITNGNGIYVDGVGLTTNFTGADLTAGNVRFVHDGSETTTASFDVNVEDGDEDGSMPTDSTFNFTVNPVNDNPSITASFDLASINEDDVSNSGTLVSSLISTSDPDIGAVSGMAVWSVDNSNGSWEFSTDGGSNWNAFGSPWTNNVRLLAADADTYVRFVPNANFNGAVSPGLRFMAWDQTIGTAGGTIDMTANFSSNAFSFGAGSSSITVNPINDAPVLTGDLTATVNEGASYTITGADLGYTDPDDVDAGITFTVSNLTNGVVQVSGSTVTSFSGTDLTAGNVTFLHDGSETITASFDVNVEDGDEDVSAPTDSTFNFTVNPVNDPSVLTADSQTVNEDNAATGNVLANDSDVDDTLSVATFTVNGDATVYNGGDTATIAGVGTVQILSDGSYTFTPAANWNGAMPQVTYTTNTGSSTTLDVTVTAVNDNFSDNNESISVDENSGANAGNVIDGTSIDGPITVTQFLINGDATVYSAGDTATIAGVGSLTLNANGDYSFTPNVDYNGTVPQVTYTLTDGSGTDDTSTLDITVDNTSDDDLPGTGGDDNDYDNDDDNDPEKDDDNDPEKDDDNDPEKDGDTDPELPKSSNPPDLRPGPPPPRTPQIDPDDPQDGIDSIIPDDEGSPSDMAAVFNDLMRGPAKPETIRVMPSAGGFFSPEALIQSLDSIGQQLDLTALASKAVQGNLIVGVTTGLTVSVFAGYVIWAFRGASLLVGAVSAMPMWRCFDPLPVLLGGDKKRSEEEEEEMTPEVEDAEDNVTELLGLEQMDSSRQVVIPEESELI